MVSTVRGTKGRARKRRPHWGQQAYWRVRSPTWACATMVSLRLPVRSCRSFHTAAVTSAKLVWGSGRIEEGHLMGDHVHMLLSIPPKYSVAQVVGFIKGK